MVMVDEQCRPLVAEAGARREVDAHAIVRTDLAALHAEAPAQIEEQRLVAEHAIGDVVAEEHPVAADGAIVEEAVEARDALDVCEREPERVGDGRLHVARQPAVHRLRFTQDLHERVRVTAAPRQQRVEGLGLPRAGGRCRARNGAHPGGLPCVPSRGRGTDRAVARAAHMVRS